MIIRTKYRGPTNTRDPVLRDAYRDGFGGMVRVVRLGGRA